MTRQTKLVAAVLTAYAAIMLAVTIGQTKPATDTKGIRSVLNHTNSPAWVTIEAEPVRAANPAPIARKATSKGRCNGESCAAPRKGEESPRRFPCLRHTAEGKPVWKLCMKPEGYAPTRTVTQLEQGGRPGAMTVVRVD